MKFSVLLPTRDRLEYLRQAIASVRQQDYENWEIIVSDNYSEAPVEPYLQSLNDPRIKYFRTESFVPVTENWNNTIERSTGDYVIMLGDDDCLLPGYFSFYLELIKQFNEPDFFYNSALIYVYPGVMPGMPNGYLAKCRYAAFFENKTTPFLVDKGERIKLVQQLTSFNVPINLNMQHSLVSRKLIKTMQSYGQFYQSPYPDYYATTALLAKAETMVAVPDRMVVVGVTPKSFGFYYFNGIEDQGTEFLKNIPDPEMYKNVSRHLLSGTSMNISWLIAMETVQKNLSKEFPLRVHYRKFRFLQTLATLKQFACRENFSLRDLLSFSKNLRISEKLLYLIPALIAYVIRMNPKNPRMQAFADKMPRAFSHPNWESHIIFGEHKDILDVFTTTKIGK